MSYSIETYDKAQNILDRRKEKATLEAQSRIDKLCAEIPELNVINRKPCIARRKEKFAQEKRL